MDYNSNIPVATSGLEIADDYDSEQWSLTDMMETDMETQTEGDTIHKEIETIPDNWDESNIEGKPTFSTFLVLFYVF